MFDLTGRRALVTGAGAGVGKGIAASLVKQGAAVAINDVDRTRSDAVADELRRSGATVVSMPFDVTDWAAVDAGVAAAAGQLDGPIDILVNNAGIPAGMQRALFHKSSRDTWNAYVDLNLYGSMYCVSAVLGGMLEADFGRIIQVSSAAGRAGMPFGVAIYGASKSGIEGFIRNLAMEVAGKGITANVIALGMMVDPESPPGEFAQRAAKSVPVGRLGTPGDAGAAAVYLASSEAGWVTGQTINVNGGAVLN